MSNDVLASISSLRSWAETRWAGAKSFSLPEQGLRVNTPTVDVPLESTEGSNASVPRIWWQWNLANPRLHAGISATQHKSAEDPIRVV